MLADIANNRHRRYRVEGNRRQMEQVGRESETGTTSNGKTVNRQLYRFTSAFAALDGDGCLSAPRTVLVPEGLVQRAQDLVGAPP